MSFIPKTMLAARFHSDGVVRIDEIPVPPCPPGGLIVKTIICGLCSGELMTWYMMRKAMTNPHVLGHEVTGIVVESQDPRFPVGTQVTPHHHAPCFECDNCKRGAHVHCQTWKSSHLDPGGMCEYFAVPYENLGDCIATQEADPADACLIEPLGCVAKQLRRINYKGQPCAIIGLGPMGLLHALVMNEVTGFDLNESRVRFARKMGVEAKLPQRTNTFPIVIVCPGSHDALELALEIIEPEGVIGVFAPLPPGNQPFNFEKAYMKDVSLVNSYSCGPQDTWQAWKWINEGRIKANQIFSDFVGIHELPIAYERMKNGEIVKAAVRFN